MKAQRLAPLSAEFENASLGDARLTRRLLGLVDAAEAKPSASLPGRASSIGELEANYRFLENESVRPEAVLAPHIAATVERAAAAGTVLVLHDTTEFAFGGEGKREGLGRLNGKTRRGFLGHFSFCTTLSGEPLGTLGLYAWHRTGKPKGRRSQKESQSDPSRESLRWQESALLTGEALHGKAEAIHVMDREGDSIELFAMLMEHQQEFVIRLSHDRRLKAGRSSDSAKLFERLSTAAVYLSRDVPLSNRGGQRPHKTKRTHPIRRTRSAHLEIRGESMEIFRGNGSSAHLPESMRLQFVEVREPRPPEGQPPVLWRLVTTRPVDTPEEVAAVVDAYRTRWLIEEFFKAIKTGCRYQDRQLQSAHSLLVDLAIETAVAWRLLLIRWFARTHPEDSASNVLNETQLHALTALTSARGQPMSRRPTVTEVLLAVAALGGHIKNNGPPGWLILRRGFETLSTATEVLNAMRLYEKRYDQ